jgi:2-polyprenyl-3-methyl-5-hydroxy-6-metoxy-1,4-benzoquinol methylase
MQGDSVAGRGLSLAWGETIPRRCPFCGDDGPVAFTRPDGLPVARCDGCACFFVARGPTEVRLREFYRGYQRIRGRDLSPERARWLLRHGEGMARGEPMVRLLRVLGVLPGGVVLDVGCGAGGFLVASRAAGGRAVGCEIDADQARFCRDALRLDVSVGGIESRPTGELVDAVALVDVIEHPLDPMALLRACVSRLRPGGVVIAWTPNGAEAETQRADWVGFHNDLEHLQYLHPHTAVIIASALGLRLLHAEGLGFPSLASPHGRAGGVRGRLRAALLALAGRAVPAPERDGRYHLMLAWQLPSRPVS